MVAASAWLQSRQVMWLNRKRFLRNYVCRQGWSLPLSYHVSELWGLIGAAIKEFGEEATEQNPDFCELIKEMVELTEIAEFERQFFEPSKPDDGLEPAKVFVSPAVTVRRTAPNANKGVGHGTSGTGNKDPSDPDGDGDGDGDSSSLLDCVSRSLILWLRTDIKTNLPALCGAGKPNHCQIGGDTFDYPS